MLLASIDSGTFSILPSEDRHGSSKLGERRRFATRQEAVQIRQDDIRSEKVQESIHFQNPFRPQINACKKKIPSLDVRPGRLRLPLSKLARYILFVEF